MGTIPSGICELEVGTLVFKADRVIAPSALLRENAVDDFTVNVGQTELAALMAISESLVINAEQMHQRRLKIVNVDAVAKLTHIGHGDYEAVLASGETVRVTRTRRERLTAVLESRDLARASTPDS